MNNKTANKLYKPSQRNSDFPYAHLPFEDYIVRIREVIAETRLDLTPLTETQIIEANIPVEYIPKQLSLNNTVENGILLIHGLLDSPISMQSFFDHYQSQGFLVRSLLLPGHGTVPGDLLEVELSSWQKAVKYAITCCKQQVKHLYIAGFSTGASLAINEAYDDPEIRGLILMAPAIRIKNPLAAISHWHKPFSCLNERWKWLHHGEETDYGKYQSITFNSISELHKLTKQIAVKHSQKPIETPLFMVLTDDDESIHSPSAEQFFKEHFNPKNRLLIYSNKRKPIITPQIEIRSSEFPEHKIVNYSHISLPISPQHPHYGIEGDYQDGRHYEQWWSMPFRKNQHRSTRYGAITKYNLCNYHLLRLHFNPDFSALMEGIDKFILETKFKL